MGYRSLIELLNKAEKLASEFKGGYSGQFLSAEEFYLALSNSICRFKQGDNSQLHKLHIWFLPTSCWDDFIGIAGEDLANAISKQIIKSDEKDMRFKNDWRHKTLEFLENDYWHLPSYDSNTVRRSHELRQVPLDSFSTEDLRLMIGQQIGLDYLIPLALEVLAEDLLVEGHYFKGDLLKVVLVIETNFWNKNKNYWLKLTHIIQGRRSEFDALGFETAKFDESIHCI